MSSTTTCVMCGGAKDDGMMFFCVACADGPYSQRTKYRAIQQYVDGVIAQRDALQRRIDTALPLLDKLSVAEDDWGYASLDRSHIVEVLEGRQRTGID